MLESLPGHLLNLLVNLLIGLQWLVLRVFAVLRQTVKRYPKESFLVVLIMGLLLLPPAQAEYQLKGSNPFRKDALGEGIPVAQVPGVPLSNRGWWMMNGERLSSPWMSLLVQAKEKGWRGKLNSGIRTREEQAHLYSLFVRGLGAPAFKPDGPSRHLERNVARRGGWYQAIDVTHPEQLIQIAKELGVHLHRPYLDEPWHIESAGFFSWKDVGR